MRKLIIIILCTATVFFMGALLETYQGSYRQARSISANEDDTSLSGYDFWSKKDANCIDLKAKGDWKANALVVIAGGIGAENDTFKLILRGYAAGGGPAEMVGDFDFSLGTQSVTKWPDGTADASAVWCDSITENTDEWIQNVAISDSGSNRVARLQFDACGYRYFDFSVADVNTSSGDGEPNSVQIWYRFY